MSVCVRGIGLVESLPRSNTQRKEYPPAEASVQVHQDAPGSNIENLETLPSGYRRTRGRLKEFFQFEMLRIQFCPRSSLLSSSLSLLITKKRRTRAKSDRQEGHDW